MELISTRCARSASVVPLVAQNPKVEVLRGAPAAERCRVQLEKRNFTEGHALCAEALKHGEFVDALRWDAYLYLKEERKPEALERLNRAAKVDPQNTSVLRSRYGLLTGNKDYLAAARDLLVIRHREPTDKWVADSVVWLVKMLNYQGNQLYKAGKNAEAAPYFQLGLELDPDNSELMFRQGRAASDSVETLLVEAQTRPDDFELRLRIDHAFASKHQYDRVVQMWNPFIEAHPDDPRPRYERGGAKWRMGQRQEALDDLQKACDLGLSTACRDAKRMKTKP